MAAITTAVPSSKRYPQRIGTQLRWAGKITGPASYTTGGDTLNPSLLGMNAIDGGLIGVNGGFTFEIIPQPNGTAKLKAYVQTTGVEVANTTSLTAAVPFAELIGR